MRKNSNSHGSARLEEAMALLIENQAAFLGRVSEMDRVNSERFARIESNLDAILRVLGEHSRLLQDHSRLFEALPEAIREKMGFKAQSST